MTKQQINAQVDIGTVVREWECTIGTAVWTPSLTESCWESKRWWLHTIRKSRRFWLWMWACCTPN